MAIVEFSTDAGVQVGYGGRRVVVRYSRRRCGRVGMGGSTNLEAGLAWLSPCRGI